MDITETTAILKQNFYQATKAIVIASSLLITTYDSVAAQTIESSAVADGMDKLIKFLN